VTPYGSCKNRCFRATYDLHQGDKNQQARNNISSNYQPKDATKYFHSVLRLLIAANIFHSRPVLLNPNDGGDTFLRNIGSYKIHTMALFIVTAMKTSDLTNMIYLQCFFRFVPERSLT
jgi:hypothetical protein